MTTAVIQSTPTNPTGCRCISSTNNHQGIQNQKWISMTAWYLGDASPLVEPMKGFVICTEQEQTGVGWVHDQSSLPRCTFGSDHRNMKGLVGRK